MWCFLKFKFVLATRVITSGVIVKSPSVINKAGEVVFHPISTCRQQEVITDPSRDPVEPALPTLSQWCCYKYSGSYGESWDSSCENHESQSRSNESQLKITSLKLKMLGPLCNQTVNLKTHSKTLYYSILKLKYSPSILKQNTIKVTWTGYFYKYTCSDQSIDLCVLWDTCHDWFCVFRDFYS